jgi:hypothetical protein
VTTGAIGSFNKGAFHLAMSIAAPIVPLFFYIPREIDPGTGYRARPGTIEVFVKPAIDTSGWRVETIVAHKEAVRDLFVQWHADMWSGPRDIAAAPLPVTSTLFAR